MCRMICKKENMFSKKGKQYMLVSGFLLLVSAQAWAQDGNTGINQATDMVKSFLIQVLI